MKKRTREMTSKHVNLQKKLELLYVQENAGFDFPEEPKATVSSCISAEPQDGAHSSLVYCSICAHLIERYVQEYLCDEPFNPACQKCKTDVNLDVEHNSDPFSSFPIEGMPTSLVSHWVLPYNNSSFSLLAIPSLKAHYVMLPNPVF